MMISVFNRLLATIAALAVLVLAVITIGVTIQALSPGVLLGWFEPQLRLAAEAATSTRVAIVAMSVITVAGMLALLLAEMLPFKEDTVHTLSITEKGTATIENESLCLLAERMGETVRDVRSVRCTIWERPEGLRIRCKVNVALGANLLEVTQGIKARVRDSIQQLTGLAVSTVDIKYTYRSDKRRHVSVQ